MEMSTDGNKYLLFWAIHRYGFYCTWRAVLLCAVGGGGGGLHLAEAPSRWLQGHRPPPSQPPAHDHHDLHHDCHDLDHDCDDHYPYDSSADNTSFYGIYTYTHALLFSA